MGGAAGSLGAGGVGGAAGATGIPCDPPNAPVSIMPVGDSITCGSDGLGGYRTPLFASLGGEARVSFVGPRDSAEVCSGPGRHAGYPGASPYLFAAPGSLPAWLPAYRPRVVLLHLGSNSDGMGATAYVANVVRPTLDWDPEVVVFVALIVSCDPTRAYEHGWNSDLRAALAAQPEAGGRLRTVDMSSILDPVTDCSGDGLHPSTAGYAKMAAAWASAIAESRVLCAP